MNKEIKHINYNAADIQSYLSGNMAPADMHALEMAALDDPFLAEAIEGYEAMQQKDWNNELGDLKNKLKINESALVINIKTNSYTKWWRVAAAILVIACSVGAAYFFTNKKSEHVYVADSKPTAASQISDNSDSTITTVGTTGNSTHYISTTEALAKKTAPDTNKKNQITFADVKVETNAIEDKEFVYQPSPEPAKAKTNAREDFLNANDDQIKNTAEGTVTPVTANNNFENEITDVKKLNAQWLNNSNSNNGLTIGNANLNNYYMAQVITPDNKPVAYANIKIPAAKKPVFTDANGYFKVASADSTLNVLVTSAGFASKKFTLQSAASQNKLVLQPTDIATRNIKTKRAPDYKYELKKTVQNADTTATDEDEEAEPSGGWAEYNNYLNNHLIFPDEARQKNIHGEVEVYVKLKNNGNISKIKVDKSLCPECDAEAIRLVKEGPKWEVKNNKASQVKVKVKF